MADPITIINGVSMGLKLVDQFRELALRFMGKRLHAPSASVDQEGDALQIKDHGKVVQTIDASQIQVGQADEVRMNALQRRIKANWELFNELYAQEPLMATDERARIKMRMDKMQGELCEDFRELVGLYERVLGTGLPDHYSLYEVCS
ncbi:MAG: hypothetical protein ACFFCW_34745 [Candidatus Hodarchaeota archaeon]